jgi:hypothetical protein
MRNREKYFLAWKAWAPVTRRMRKLEMQCSDTIREKNLVRVFDTMTRLCKEAMGRRASALKALSGSMFNRKLLMCAHALSNRVPNMLMIDCWRRWVLWTKNRKKYLSFLWQFRYQYHEARSRMIFNGWRDYVRYKKQLAHSKANTPKGRKGSVMSLSDDERSLGSTSTLDTADREFSLQLQLLRANSNATPSFLHTNSFSYAGPNSPSGKPGSRVGAATADGDSPISRVPPLSTVASDDASVASVSSSVAEWAAGTITTVEGSDNNDHFKVPNPLLIPLIMENAMRIFTRSRREYVPITAAANAFRFFCVVSAFTNGAALRNEINAINSLNSSSDVAAEMGKSEIRKMKELYDKLQNSVNNLHLDDVAAAVEGGARVSPSQIAYVGKFVSDEFVPLFSYLLSSCPMYFAHRVMFSDRMDRVMEIASPLSAVLMSSQAERWERRSLTSRESNYLVSSASQEVIGTNFQTNLIWRAAVLSLLKLRGQELAIRCVKLQPTRTVDEEVVEVMKRQKVARIIAIRQSIAQLLCIDLSNEANPLVVPELLTNEPPWKKGQPLQNKRLVNAFGNTAHMNIYELLKQYTQITGHLTAQARALRLPMLQRDDRLNHNGFLRQARADFLALRQMCLTPEQRRLQKAEDYAREMAAISRKDRDFTLKENTRKKEQAAELAAKKKAQKEIEHKIAMRLLPADALHSMDERVESPQLTTDAILGVQPAPPGAAEDAPAGDGAASDTRTGRSSAGKKSQSQQGKRGRSTSKSADGRPPRSSGPRSPSANPTAPKHKAGAGKKEVVTLTQRKFSFLDASEGGDEGDSAMSSTVNSPRDPDAPKPKANPLRALFTKDPTKSAKQLRTEEKTKSLKAAKPDVSMKFLYDGETFQLVKKGDQGDTGDNVLSRGAEAAAMSAKEDHIHAILKATTSTSIGKSLRKKADIIVHEEDGDDDNETLESSSSTESSAVTKEDTGAKKVNEADALTAAAKLKAQARMTALKQKMGDGDWEREEEDSEENGENNVDARSDAVTASRVTTAAESEDVSPPDSQKASRRATKLDGKSKSKKKRQDSADETDADEEEGDAEGDDEPGGDEEAAEGDDDQGAITDTDFDGDAEPGDGDEENGGKAKKSKKSGKKGASTKGAKKGGASTKTAKKSGKASTKGGKKSQKSRSPSPDKMLDEVPKPIKVKPKAVSELRDRNVRNEEFAERAKSFKGLLLESWQCRAKRDLEAVRKTLAVRECLFAQFVGESILARFLYDGGMEEPSNPPDQAHGGLGGWILKKSLTDIAFITAEVLVLFIPSAWWKVPSVYERLENEFLLVNTLYASGKDRIRFIESRDILIQDQQRDATNYLKVARREVAAIGAKRFQIIQEDNGQAQAMKRIITKTRANVVKANHNLNSFRDQLKKGEDMLEAQNYDGIFELFEEGAGYNENVVDMSKIEARAAAVVEKQQLLIPKLYQKIVDAEAAVRKAEADMKNFERSTARVQEMLRRFGEGRFNIVIDVQQVCIHFHYYVPL